MESAFALGCEEPDHTWPKIEHVLSHIPELGGVCLHTTLVTFKATLQLLIQVSLCQVGTQKERSVSALIPDLSLPLSPRL